MNIEQLLAETFADHTDLAPDEADVRARIDARIAGPRRAHTRPLAVAASVLVVAGAAVATALGTSGGTSHTPAATTPTCHARPGTAPRFTSLSMPFVLGYLPQGQIQWTERYVAYTGSGTHASVNGFYQLNVADHYVSVQPSKTTLHSVAEKRGVRAITIHGRPGYQSTSTGSDVGSQILFRDTQGKILSVLVSPDATPVPRAEKAGLARLTRRIAEGVSFRTTVVVPAAFGLGVLPAGYRVTGLMANGGHSSCATDPGAAPDNTLYELHPGADARQVISIGTALSEPAQPQQARRVQGHRTRYGVHGGQHVLQVLDAVGNRTVTLTGEAASRATLYRLADHLQLPKS